MEEHISKIPTGINAAANAVLSLAHSDDPVLKMLKMEPTVDPMKLPDQLIQRKFTEALPTENGDYKKEGEAAIKDESLRVETVASLTAAQKLNKSNPLGVIMFGGHVEPAKPVKPVEPVKPTAALPNGNSVAIAPAPPEPAKFKVPSMPMPTMSMPSSIPLPSASSAGKETLKNKRVSDFVTHAQKT